MPLRSLTEAIRSWLADRRLARWDGASAALLALLGGAYTLINLARLRGYYMLDYDLAIFGQGLWLLSRGESPCPLRCALTRGCSPAAKALRCRD